jgi:hypothetical protein
MFSSFIDFVPIKIFTDFSASCMGWSQVSNFTVLRLGRWPFGGESWQRSFAIGHGSHVKDSESGDIWGYCRYQMAIVGTMMIIYQL